MTGERVLDASVAAALSVSEVVTPAARRALASGHDLAAPDSIFAELAHVMAKRLRRKQITLAIALDAVRDVAGFLTHVEPVQALAERAVVLADGHGITGYDAIYVALAEQRGVPLLTADARLAERMREAGLGAMVDLLEP